MSGNNFLLDTNIVIEVFKGNKDLADKISKLPDFYLSSVILGELYIGINRITNKAKHLKELQNFLQLCTVLNVDEITAQYYGTIAAALYKKGKPIPINDVWIAASTLQHSLILVTRDKHFAEIPDLKTKFW